MKASVWTISSLRYTSRVLQKRNRFINRYFHSKDKMKSSSSFNDCERIASCQDEFDVPMLCNFPLNALLTFNLSSHGILAILGSTSCEKSNAKTNGACKNEE